MLTTLNLRGIIIQNRANTKAITGESFLLEVKERQLAIKYWKEAVENIRNIVSEYAAASRNNAPDSELSGIETKIFAAYRFALSFFTENEIDGKVKPQHSDLNVMLTFCGANRKVKNSMDGKDFLPVSAEVFRKSLEDFIADRLTGREARSAADIEAAKMFDKGIRAALKKNSSNQNAAQKITYELVGIAVPQV